jgi:hypothetical protein
MCDDAPIEPLHCTEIVVRVVTKRKWIVDGHLMPEAFLLKIYPDDSVEEALSVGRRAIATVRLCRSRMRSSHGAATLHVGHIRSENLINVFPDPVLKLDGREAQPEHALIVNLPNPITQNDLAEYIASKLAAQARLVSFEEEEDEHLRAR